MSLVAAILDASLCRSLPAGSGFLSRGGAHNIPVQVGSDPPTALLEPVCPQVKKLACLCILPFTVGHYETGHAFAFQMSAAYSAIVRSLENFPEVATFKIALRDHSAGSAYSSHSCWSACR